MLIAAAAAPDARADVVSLHQMLGFANSATTVLMSDAEYNVAYNDWERARAEKGWKLGVAAGYGTQRDLIDETRARDFEAIRSEVKLSYPLLGAHAEEQRAIEGAAGELNEARIKRDMAHRIAELHLEDVYAAFWGAQESLEFIDAYLKLGARAGADDEGPAKARRDRRRLSSRREAALARLELLAGRPFPDLVVSGVQLPTMPEIDLKKLEQDHPDLAALRARHRSRRAQLDGSVWYGIGASFDLTQTTIQDRDSGQAGNALFAHVTVQLPVSFYAAGLAERRKLRAEMDFLELKLQDRSGEVVAKARDSEAEYLDLAEEVETASTRARATGQALRDLRERATAAQLRDYYAVALKEIDARTRFWRSHVELRSFIPVGAAEPAPEPTGPATADVGTRLIEPLLAAGRGG